MIERLEADSRIACAQVFGSAATGRTSPYSDVDVAAGLAEGVHLQARDAGALAARLEEAAGRALDEALRRNRGVAGAPRADPCVCCSPSRLRWRSATTSLRGG